MNYFLVLYFGMVCDSIVPDIKLELKVYSDFIIV